jgi:hypothetical protein
MLLTMATTLLMGVTLRDYRSVGIHHADRLNYRRFILEYV